MDDISNFVNFDVNENLPVLSGLKVSDNDVLNGSVERSSAESVTFVLSNPLAEKNVLTSVNNYFKNGKPDISFTVGEDSTEFTTNNSEKNITLPSLDAIIPEAESINSSSLVNEISISINTSNCISFNSEQNNSEKNGKPDISSTVGEDSTEFTTNNSEKNIALSSSDAIIPEAESINSSSLVNEISMSINTSNCISFNSGKEFENVSCTKFTNPCMQEIPVGNVNFLPDALSNEDIIDNCKNLSDNTVQCKKMSISKMENNGCISTCVEELEHGKANSCVIIPDLVDFSFREQENVTDDLLGSFTCIDSVPGQSETFSNGILVNNSVIRIQENNSASTSAEFDSENAVKRSKSPTINHLEETALTDAAKIYTNVLGDPKSDVSSHCLSENAVSNALAIDNISVELQKPCKVTVGVSLDDSCKLDVSTNNEYKEVNSGVPGKETAFEVPQDDSVNESDEISPLKVEKIVLNISGKSIEKCSDISIDDEYRELNSATAFQMPKNISNYEAGEVSPLHTENVSYHMPEKTLEHLSDPDFSFKVPEVPFNNLLRNPDFALKMQENITNETDEQFVDAVQFFKDPNSFQFLENIRTSTIQSGSPVPRSSLYVNFDPLHSKFQNALKQDNCALITAAVQENNASEKCSPEIVKKHLVDGAARESLGNNILISFDSPKPTTVDSKILVQTPTAPKMITEEELQQKLKIHELETQEVYLKKQKEMEMQITKRDELLMTQQKIMEELNGISARLYEENRKSDEKIMSLTAENEKLKEDFKTSSEDLQSVENTFTDFYKRYEQCKGMLKSFKDNEDQLKQTILDFEAKEKEQEQMYSVLKERTEEILEKVYIEMDNVKRSGEAQLTVLKAQLKKAEMKISSLESDNKQIKIENSQLGGICDDLMAKVSKS